MTAASKRFTVHRAPKVLTVCLKRFEAFTGDKISKVCAQMECNVLFLEQVSQSRMLFHKLLMLRFSHSLLGTLPVGRQVCPLLPQSCFGPDEFPATQLGTYCCVLKCSRVIAEPSWSLRRSWSIPRTWIFARTCLRQPENRSSIPYTPSWCMEVAAAVQDTTFAT